MKKILLSLSIITAVAALVIGGTFAYFSDTETSTGNTFTAGTLNLNLTDTSDDGTESETVTWVFSDIAPGASGGGQRLTVQNTGSLDGYIDLSGITVTNTDPTNPESEPVADRGVGQLGANLKVQIWLDTDNDGVVNLDADGKLAEESIYPAAAIGADNPGVTGVLDNIASSYDLDEPLDDGTSKYISLLWVLPSGTGNAVQGDVVSLSFTVELDQTAD